MLSIKMRKVSVPGFKSMMSTIIFLLLITGLASAQCSTTISAFPYNEGFENGPAWTSGGTNNDWEWGTPAHPFINAAGGGTKSWCVGGLTGTYYNANEQSYLLSPCFDFSGLQYPWISFKLFWETERQYDGLQLQYSTNGGTSWTRVGAYNDPVNCLNQNWYNISSVNYLNLSPAGWRHAWSGRVGNTGGSCAGGNGSNGWVTASHCISNLAGKTNVRFRFIFGAGTTCNSFDGIGLDDILIQDAPPNDANFNYTCTGGNSIQFTNQSPLCPDSYSWDFGDPASGTANTSSLENPSHTFSAPGTYNVTLSISGPCNAPDVITIPVTVFSVTASSTNVTCHGQNNGTATANVSGNGNFIYHWLPGGQTTSSVSGLGPGTYTVTVSTNGGCSSVSTVTITEPPALSAPITNIVQPACAQNNGSITISVTGGTVPYTYSWSPAGGSGPVASNLYAGTYTVTVTDGHGCTSITSTVLNNPTNLAVSVQNTTNVTCNGGSNGSISVSASGGVPGYTYLWMPSGGSSATASSLSAGTYSVTVTDAAGCVSFTQATVTQPPVLQAQVVSVTNVSCFGGSNGSISVAGAGGTGGYTYSWSPAGSNTSAISNLSQGNYTVILTDASGCTTTSSVVVTQPPQLSLSATGQSGVSCYGFSDGAVNITATGGTGNISFSWNPGGSLGSHPVALSAGNYVVTATDANGCTSTMGVTITQPSPIILNTTLSDDSICAGDMVTLGASASGGYGGYTYSWNGNPGSSQVSFMPGATTSYTVVVTDQHLCTAQQILPVYVGDVPLASFTVPPACIGSASVFTNTSSVNSGSIVNTTWNFGDGSPADNNSNTTHTYTSPGQYTVHLDVVSDFGCAASVSGTATVNIYPVVDFTADVLTGCSPLCVTFTDLVQTGGAMATAYQWLANGVPFSSQQSPVHCFNTAGVYNIALNVTLPGNCSTLYTLPAYIDVLQTPVADFFVSDDEVMEIDPHIRVIDNSMYATSWYWNFGDGSTSVLQNDEHFFPDTGTYCISLFVTADNGCVDSTAHCIDVVTLTTVYIPNTITVNEDHLNEAFKIYGYGLVQAHLLIYTRWGELIFEQGDMLPLLVGWDGYYKNEPVPEGVYAYKVFVLDQYGHEYEYMGHIQVIR